MKKYIEFDDFKNILNNLKLNEEITFYSEIEEGFADEYDFKVIDFHDTEVILYNVPQTNQLGVIQDSMYMTRDEEMLEVWQLLCGNGEYKVYINK